ncbi:MAG: hypothetical protein ACXAEU_17280 [Candidatus Hodarchaeales archaeon]|jgi:hypothetical protein
MADEIQILMEISFNLVYLVFIWFLVTIMTRKMGIVAREDISIAKYFRLAFFLLALGDTGHVGFRVIAYVSGGLEINATLVGLGALSTAITVTLFYMALLEVWRLNFRKERDVLYYLLMVTGVIRFIMMIFPQNQWGSMVPPPDWGLLRNIPLVIMGIAVAFLMLRDGYKEDDSRYKIIGYCIVASYAFYLPVIFFVQQIPVIGMLMIPKTIAYMVIAWLAYKYYFTSKESREN